MNYGETFSQALEAGNMLIHGEWMDLAMETAMEVDMSNPTTNTMTQQQKRSNAATQAADKNASTSSDPVQVSVKRVQSLADAMLNKINSVHRRTYKMLFNTWESNNKFIEQYDEMSREYKLLNSITVVNWTYGHDMEQYLHAKVVTLRAFLTTNANYLNNWQNAPDNAAVNMDGTELSSEILAQIGSPSSIDDLSEFMGHLRAQFRGRKSEKQYNGGQANTLMQEIRGFDKTRSAYAQDINAAERITKTARDIVMGQMRNNNFQDSDRTMMMKMLKRVYKIVSWYITLINFVYRLEVEYILNRRAIVTRLYEK